MVLMICNSFYFCNFIVFKVFTYKNIIAYFKVLVNILFGIKYEGKVNLRGIFGEKEYRIIAFVKNLWDGIILLLLCHNKVVYQNADLKGIKK